MIRQPVIAPAMKAAVFFIAGIVSSKLFSLPVYAAGLSALLTFCAACIAWQRGNQTLVGVTLGFALALCGHIRILQVNRLPSNHAIFQVPLEHSVILDGIVLQDIPSDMPSLRIIIGLTHFHIPDSVQPIQGKVLASFPSSIHTQIPQYGDRVRIRGRLIRPSPPANPGQFDYANYLSRQSVHLRILCDAPITILDGQGGSRLLRRFIYPLRRRFFRILGRSISSVNLPLMSALLLGDKSRITDDQRESFSKAGVIHTLAVSGLHVGYILMIFSVLGSFFRLKSFFRLAFISLGLVIFCFLTGSKPPVLRATLMAVLYLLARDLERFPQPVNSIGFSALVLLMINPMDLFDAGFQLSYSAVLSIVTLQPRLKEWTIPITSRLPPWLAGSLSLVCVSLSAQMGTLPVISAQYHLFPLYGVLANCLIVPLTGIVTALGFITLIFGFFSSFLSMIYGGLADQLMTLLSRITGFVSRLPGASLPIPPLSIWFWVGYLFLLLAITIRSFTGIFKKVMFASFLTLNIHIWKAAIQAPARTMTWIQLDVGQGDSAVLHLPRRKHIIIDTGDRNPRYDSGKHVLIPYLRSRGIQTIDALFLTHPHNDHIGGTLSLMEYGRIRRLFVTERFQRSKLFQEILKRADQCHIPVIRLTAPDTLIFPGIRMLILSPDSNRKKEVSSGRWNANNQSIVLRIRYGDHNFLLTGDAEIPVEKTLIESNLPLQSDVVKCGHHGSSTSSSPAFIAAIRPQFAVISSGRNNRFGHPSPQVVQYLQKMHISVSRTDRHGAVFFYSDGKYLRKSHFKNRQ
ncbi:MAG TPA: DNA internalization-related competence protein ComEC/Rec2 [bacterium]|nr:DNA internalization-related competence protein ComEC/Rec2 [bacterium]